MTPRSLDWALRVHGPDLDTWPAAEREAALALLRNDPAARRTLADAWANEDAPASDLCALRRMQTVVRRALTPPPPVLRSMRWGALAACAAAGLYLGVGGLGQAEADASPMIDTPVPATVLAAIGQ